MNIFASWWEAQEFKKCLRYFFIFHHDHITILILSYLRLPANATQATTTYNKRWQFYIALVHSVSHVQRPERTLIGQQPCFFIFGTQPTGDDLSDLALLQTYWRQSYVISTEIRTAGNLSSELKFLVTSNSATCCLKRKGILKNWRHNCMAKTLNTTASQGHPQKSTCAGFPKRS